MSTRSRRSSASQRPGFTLLELIIAMAIAASLALILYSSLSTAFRARTTAMNQTASMREAAIALDIIEADLQSATPPADTSADTSDTGGGTSIGTGSTDKLFGEFVGQPSGADATAADSLAFCCLGRESRTTTGAAAGVASTGQEDPLAEGVRQVTYAIAADSSGKNVLMRSLVRNLLPSSTATPEDEPLAGDVSALSFRYYDGTTWTDTWSSDDQQYMLPLAVEVGIDIKTTDAKGVETTYHMTRMVPMPCSTITSDTTTTTAAG